MVCDRGAGLLRNGRILHQRPRFVAAVLVHRFHAAIIMQPRSCWRICFWGNGGARCDFRIYDCRRISQAQKQDNIARYFKAPTKMSEYQYYEFQRVDGRLSEKEMQELRAYSTRARITPTSFINEYHFGSFKGNPDVWMEKYFDGYLYLANWGTREVQLAVPAKMLPSETARRYCSSRAASSREKSGKVILTFCSDEEPDGVISAPSDRHAPALRECASRRSKRRWLQELPLLATQCAPRKMPQLALRRH